MNLGLSSAWRTARRALAVAGGASGLLLGLAAPAQARSDITPYIQVQQVFEAEVGGGGDVLTYTSVAAGVDARVSTRRAQGQISYRYERRIDWDDKIGDQDVHSGIAQVRLEVAPEVLSVDAGALAARSRFDPRGPATGFSAADGNVAQVYGAYAGPSLSTHVGDVAVQASYHLGYVKVDADADEDLVLPGGPLDRYDSSTTHDVQASVGMAPGRLPVGWTVAAGYQRETTNRLDQKFEGKYVRGDVVVPVSSHLAVTGGIGYEKLESSQDDFLRDAGGVPITDSHGELIADKSKPRLLAYDQSGLIWDAGVIWRPNPRTELQARVGRRYGGTTVVGTLKYQLGRDYALSAVVYDSVTSFGRLVVSNLNGLPTEFNINHRGLNSGLGGAGSCVFGNEPGTGHCFDDTFQSVTTSNFRNRGIGILFSGRRGVWDMQIGAGYARRKYLAAPTGLFSLDGVVDESAMVEAAIGRRLTRTSGIDFDAYAMWFNSGISGNDDSSSVGGSATYYRSFLLDRLQAQASIGLFSTSSGGEDSTVAEALLGLSYTF